MGLTRLQPGACCGCAAATCTQAITVKGCNNLGVSGLTVSVYTSNGGSLLASGTTDANGQVVLSWPGASGSYYVTVTGSARFASYGQTLTLACPSGTATITLTVATGYHCASGSGCALPYKDTLHASDTLLGAATLTYQTSGTYSGSWIATTSYTYAGLTQPNGVVYCFSGTVTIFWRVTGGTFAIEWDCGQNQVCPDSNNDPWSDPSNCSGVNSVTLSTSIACPPSLSITQTVVYNGNSTQPDPYLDVYTSNGSWSGSSPNYNFVWNVAPGTTISTRTVTE